MFFDVIFRSEVSDMLATSEQDAVPDAVSGRAVQKRITVMLIEEIIRSCRSESVAQAAVASIGPQFARDVESAAQSFGMSIGGFAAHSVERFADRGDEKEMRAVLAAMGQSPAPILAGLKRILSIRLSATAEDRTSTQPPSAFA